MNSWWGSYFQTKIEEKKVEEGIPRDIAKLKIYINEHFAKKDEIHNIQLVINKILKNETIFTKDIDG